MPRISNILRLPPEQKRWLDEQLTARVRQLDILAEAKELGIPLTSGGLNRYAKSWAAQTARVQLLAEQARAIVVAAGTGMEVTEAATQVATAAVLERLLALTEEDVEKLSLYEAADAATRLAKAEVARRKLKADEARAAKKDAKEAAAEQAAAQAAEKKTVAGTRVEATPELAQAVRDVYGLKGDQA